MCQRSDTSCPHLHIELCGKQRRDRSTDHTQRLRVKISIVIHCQNQFSESRLAPEVKDDFLKFS